MRASLKLCNIRVKQADGISQCSYDQPPYNMSEANFTPAMGDILKRFTNMVFVVDKNKKPCNPCHPAKARILLGLGKAAVLRRFPFIIILKEEKVFDIQLLRLKIDPGSKTTGLAIVNDTTGVVLFALEITHRGHFIHEQLLQRRALRSSRRNRKTRYRKPRFDNRRRPEGWIAPSLESRVANIMTWVIKLMRYCPIGALSQELVRFDTQLMLNAEISGIGYQQGELAGYEIREYLLEKFKRCCAYCTLSGIPLEIEHIVPVSRGGTNRVSLLTLACRSCNQSKANKTAQKFGYPEIHKQALAPLKDAAAVNITRLKLYNSLLSIGLPVETGTGGRTKFNRTKQNLLKTHWLDAACVGASTPEQLIIKQVNLLSIKATGHGSRQMCKVDKYGFPRTSAKEAKKCFGFQTGDMVQALVTKGKKIGRYTGKVAIRTSGYFNITTTSTVQGINFKYCKLIHACDGYSYNYKTSASSAP